MPEYIRGSNFTGETPEERRERVKKLTELVANGQYQPDPMALGKSILAWDGFKTMTSVDPNESASRRRDYQREYIRMYRLRKKG